MKKILLFSLFFVLSMAQTNHLTAQVLNQPANWPNVNWTVTGTYNADPTAFEADPTVTANFAFDDDDAGGTSDDDIAAESPVIDLTAAHTAGETEITVSYDYVYNFLADVIELQYYDADAASWVTFESLAETDNSITDNFCTGTVASATSPVLDISSFTASQLSGFRYRFSYLDDGGAGGAAWEWGFCISSPTIQSNSIPSCDVPTGLASANVAATTADITWTDGLGCIANKTVTVSPAIAGSPFTVACGTGMLSLTGLTAATAYTVTIANDCGAMPSADVMFTTTASCTAPSALASANVTATTADITWTDGVGCTANKTVTVSPAIAGSPFTVACGTGMLSLTGLTAATAYTVTIANDCGASPSTDVTFTTACGAVTPCYDTDFATFLPTCWDEANDGDASTGPTGLGAGAWGGSGTLARMNLWNVGDSDWLLTPEFDLSAGGYQLVIGNSAHNFSNTATFSGMGSDDYVDVLISADGGTTWSSIYTFDASNPPSLTVSDAVIDLSAYTGTSYLFGILGSEGTLDDPEDYYFNVHDFEICTPPACAAPTGLAAANVTATTADITWTDGIGCIANKTVTVSPAIAGSPFTVACGTGMLSLTGLAAETAYTVTVANDCGASPSTDVTFTTPCAVVTPCYNTNFTPFLPNCWDEANDGDASTGPMGLGAGAWGQQGTLARINLWNTGDSDWLLTPEFDLSAGGYQLVIGNSAHDFANNATFAGMGSDDYVNVLISADGGTTWSSIYTFDASNPPSLTVSDAVIDLSAYTGTSYLFGILGSEGTLDDPEDYYFNVHDFEICTPPTCGPGAVGLPMGAGTTASVGSCEDGTWTYYQDAGGDNIFAIEWDPTAIGGGHNAAAKAAASVTIQVDASPNSPNNPTAGTYFMGRQWDVDLGGATLDGPVNIKYYYDPAEKTAAETASANHATTNGTTDNGFSWFKMNGSADFSAETDASFQPDVYLTEAGSGMENGVTYAQFDGIASFSSGSGGAGSGGGALPVEFTSFSGRVDGKFNLLNWVTATEENSSHYEVERSANGISFENIGRVEAAGNSVEVLTYNFVDEKPLAAAYYRLKQVDLDGTYDYSKTINIVRANTSISIGNVRPNPTKKVTTVQFNVNASGTVNISLTDVNGKIVSTQQFDAVSGINQRELDLSNFANGVYFLSISNDGDKAVTRIMKSN